MSHTPTPWSVKPEDLNAEGGYFLTGRLSNGTQVTICGRADWANRAEMSVANARLIVRAVNHHEALLQALREMVDRHESADETPGYVVRARAVLASAAAPATESVEPRS